jgi:ABC-type Fe3+ transport system permease subunit
VLVKRFFDNLPRELFEAARIDGAGNVRIFLGIVLPLSKPILGVVSIFAVLSESRNFLWPFLVLSNSPDRQPLSVRLPAIQAQTDLGVPLAAMLIAALVPILAFLIFQRTILRGSGLGGTLQGEKRSAPIGVATASDHFGPADPGLDLRARGWDGSPSRARDCGGGGRVFERFLEQ